MMYPIVQHFFEAETQTFSYVVYDPTTKHCAIIDSVLNYDAASASTNTTSADAIIAYIQQQALTVQWILETHVHADHLTASQYLKAELGGQIAMSKRIEQVQAVFAPIYHVDLAAEHADVAFDYLFEDGEHFQIGQIDAYNIPTAGHTPACLSYVIGNCVFVGDTLFMPDYGTARCDFPKGSAAQLYDSIQTLYQLPEYHKVFLCHDYLPKDGRTDFCYQTSILAQKQHNIHIHEGVSKAEFIAMRQQRDASLSMPKLILPSIQVNMLAGRLPQPESNGIAYLKLPLNFFK